MDDVVDEIKHFIDKNSSDDSADDYLLMNGSYEAIALDKKNFHPIDNSTDIDDERHKEKSGLLFVDGGNSIIFESANFCLGFIRVAGLVYEDNVRISRHIKEFYVIISQEEEKFVVKTFPDSSMNGIIFDPDDASLKIGKEKCSISRIVSIIRRFAELEHAYSLDSQEISYIILDGTLEARYPFESEYLNKAFLTKKVSALSKTCSLTTKQGKSITKKLLDMSAIIHGSWFYNPIVINNNPMHDAEIYFVRLNGRSDYVFRFEIQKDMKDSRVLFSWLSNNSNDPIFLGYPYGFIDVDQNARIGQEETKMLRMKFAVKLGKRWNDLAENLNSMNAHDMLDKIRF